MPPLYVLNEACTALSVAKLGRVLPSEAFKATIRLYIIRRGSVMLLLQLEGEATMKFVTSAYKKKLMEQKKWELQQQLEDEREQRNDVTKTGMSGYVRVFRDAGVFFCSSKCSPISSSRHASACFPSAPLFSPPV